MKEKITYSEKYTKPGREIRQDSLPSIPSMSEGFAVKEAYILEAGTLEKDGKKLEYQIIKVLISDAN